MFYLLCFGFYVLCFMFCVLHFMFCVLCFVFCVLCFMSYVFESRPRQKLFGSRVLAHPCNPATWRSRSVTRRMSCLVHRLVSKSCLIITHPAALPPKYCVGSVERIASGKVVVIRQPQPSGIL